MELKDSQTAVNLAAAFAGECQSRVRYEFIEYGARMKGYAELANKIDKIAYNEFHHARMFYTKLQDAGTEIQNVHISRGYPFKEKWDLEQNLLFASQDEEAEIKLYPKFAVVAEKEGFNDIATLFREIAVIEKGHRKMFLDMYNKLKDGKLYRADREIVWKCPDCGYEFKGKECFDKCPVCQAEQGRAVRV